MVLSWLSLLLLMVMVMVMVMALVLVVLMPTFFCTFVLLSSPRFAAFAAFAVVLVCRWCARDSRPGLC